MGTESTGLSYKIEYNNSAGRLLALLRELRRIVCADESKSTIVQVYQEMFSASSIDRDAPTNTTSSSLQAAVEVNLLVDEVLRDAIGQCRIDPELQIFDLSLQKIEGLRVSFLPNSEIKDCAQKFDNPMEMALVTFAKALSTEPELDVKEVESIRQSIDDLMTQLADSDLPHDIRTFLFNMQRVCRDMLDRFRIAGTHGIKEDFHKVLGEMADVYRSDPRKEDENSNMWTRIKAIFGRFDELVTKTSKYPALVNKSGAAVDAIEQMLD